LVEKKRKEKRKKGTEKKKPGIKKKNQDTVFFSISMFLFCFSFVLLGQKRVDK